MAWVDRNSYMERLWAFEGTRKPSWRKTIYFISSPAQEFELTQIDLDASKAPSPLRDSWESHLRLLISPASNEDLRPGVLQTA